VLSQLKADSTIIDFTAYGDPPHTYLIRFKGKGFTRARGNAGVKVLGLHEVRIELGASYPRLMPEMAWQTPIFHPNISGSGVVCLGGYGTYWVPSLNLDELCEMLWDMIRYKNYDVGSPYNRDAAHWAKFQTEYRLPIDGRPIRDKLARQANVAAQTEAMLPPRIDLPTTAPPVPGQQDEDILFLDNEEVVEAEIVEPDDPDILIIQ